MRVGPIPATFPICEQFDRIVDDEEIIRLIRKTVVHRTSALSQARFSIKLIYVAVKM